MDGGYPIACFGKTIYIFHSKTITTFNLETNTFKDIKKDSEYSINSSWGYTFIGNDMYLIGDKFLKYNILTNEYTVISETVPYTFSSSKVYLGLVGNRFYVVDGSGKIHYFSLTTKKYDKNTLILAQGKYNQVGYEIKPFSNKLIKDNLIFQFTNAWFYSDHLETDLPTYYGNGTEWIKIKN